MRPLHATQSIFEPFGKFVEGQVGVSLTPVNGVFEISAGGSKCNFSRG